MSNQLPLVEVIAKQYFELTKEFMTKKFKESGEVGPLNGILITDPVSDDISLIIVVGYVDGELSYEHSTKTSLVDNDKLLNTFSTNTMVNPTHLEKVRVSILYNLIPKGME